MLHAPLSQRRLSIVLISLCACSAEPSSRVEPGLALEPTALSSPEQRPLTDPPGTASASSTVAPASASASAPPLPNKPAPLSLGLTAGAPPAGVPSALYASLFEIKRSWKLSGEKKHSHTEDKPVNTKVKFSATCQVISVESYTWGVWSQVSCKDLPDAGSTNLLAGHWFATERGLFHLEDIGAGGLVLEHEALVLPTVPKAEQKEEKDAEMEGFFSKRRVYQEKAAWCVEFIFAGGDEGWHGVCIDEKRGFVSGNYGWAGGSSDEVTFTAR